MIHLRMSPEAPNDCGAPRSAAGEDWTLDYSKTDCPACLRASIAMSRKAGLHMQADAMAARLAALTPQHTMPKYDAELLSLFGHLATHAPDWHLIGATCGEGPTVWASEGLAAMFAELTATDEATAIMRNPTTMQSAKLFLVWGNGPGELVSDGTCPQGTEELWAAVDAWSDREMDREMDRAEKAPARPPAGLPLAACGNTHLCDDAGDRRALCGAAPAGGLRSTTSWLSCSCVPCLRRLLDTIPPAGMGAHRTWIEERIEYLEIAKRTEGASK